MTTVATISSMERIDQLEGEVAGKVREMLRSLVIDIGQSTQHG